MPTDHRYQPGAGQTNCEMNSVDRNAHQTPRFERNHIAPTGGRQEGENIIEKG